MNKFHEYQQEVAKELESATDLLTQTYPLSNDPKVLVSVLHHIRLAQQHIISFLNQLEGKQETSIRSLVQQVDEESLAAFETTEELYVTHQESDVEFSRKETYVLANKDYDLSTLKESQLKALLRHTIKVAEQFLR